MICGTERLVRSTLLDRFRSGSPQAVAGQAEPLSVMDEAVENGVGIGRIADHGVPAFDGELAGDDGGASSVAFLKNLEQVVAGLGVERLEPPVVEDQELDAAEGADDAGIAAVAAGEREIAEQLGDALVEHRAIIPAGLVAEGAGQPTLADASRAANDQTVVRVDPIAAASIVL